MTLADNGTLFTNFHPRLDQCIGIIGLVLGFYTLIANVLVLVILHRFKRKTVSDVIFANLAITDVIGGVDAIFAFIVLLTKRRFFEYMFFDDIICQFTAISWCVISICTPMMLALASIGRFLALYIPHKYDKYFTHKFGKWGLIFIWMLSTIGGTMHIYKNENMRFEAEWGYCDYRLVEIYSKVEVRYIVVFLYSIPLLVATVTLLLCNISVSAKLLYIQCKASHSKTRPVASISKGLGSALSTSIPVSKSTKIRPESTALLHLEDSSSNLEGATSPPRRTIGNQLWRVGAARITESQEKELAANSAAPPSASDTCSTRPNKRISVMQAFSKSKLETLQLLKMRRERLVRTQSGAEIRRKKERHIIIATFLFSFTFVSCNSIMLYYYFAYMINPSLGVFTLISGGDPIRLTYLTGWFYYATFLTSCINPMIHFSCNSKMRDGMSAILKGLRQCGNQSKGQSGPTSASKGSSVSS